MGKGNGEFEGTGVQRGIEDIKRLLILALLRDRVKQEVVAKALGVAQSTISKMFPGGLGEINKAQQSK